MTALRSSALLLLLTWTSHAFTPSSSRTTTTAFTRSSTSAASSASALFAKKETKKVVVIGNGMVGQRMMENLLKLNDNEDSNDDNNNVDLQLATFCEESLAAYNRVKLTSFFESRNPSDLSMTGDFDADGRTPWYEDNHVELLLGDQCVELDTAQKVVKGASGKLISYDKCVLATGSVPFVPPIPGVQRPGVFVYRTIQDLQDMLEYAKVHNVQSAAVIGGGLLGLEAAKAAADMGLESHIIEFADILMCRQIDQGGHDALVQVIEDMGLQVHCGARTEAVVGMDGSTNTDDDAANASPVAALRFSNDGWDDLPVQMVIVSAGIKPRDELARQAGLKVGERGGVVVNSKLQTSDPDIYAVGEIALYNNFIYGLIAPGYTMAQVAAEVMTKQLQGKEDTTDDDSTTNLFTGADMSTKLKLLGCDVASFGVNQPAPDDTDVSYLVWNDPVQRVYRKLVLNKDGTKLRGGILVGDASDYTQLHQLAVSDDNTLAEPASMLLAPPSARGSVVAEEAVSEDPNAQICSCNDVSRGQIAATVAELGVDGATLGAVKKCSNAGTGCGGCEPAVKSILSQELEKLGGSLSNHLCEHFGMSRPELMAKVRLDPDINSVDSFDKILKKFGHADSEDGCEICKPAVGSILASLVNGVIIDDGRDALQDTNDRSMANMQRGGTYSVVPRVAGGEISPDQLIALGDVANKYNLYSKITGAQRVDLFGAERHNLPDIWEELGKAGFESGHAYGKALRTVKSCVGSTWCRYGVQDSVSFAVRVENRYKGVRSPHKLKSGVSGCTRECAEAVGKDFGMIATESGYNLYFGGNGGAIPVHAELFATDLDEDTVLQYIDRYLMYYILTADRLERTAPWQKKLPSGKDGSGPIGHLREVIIEDSLGIVDELDSRMQHLVDTYHDEWAEVVNDPERRAKFQQFVNTDETIPKDSMIESIDIRGQVRPADWPKDGEPQTNWKAPPTDIFAKSAKSWVEVGDVSQFAPNIGSPILYGESQLAVFNNAQRGEWHCTQNMCPHKQAFVLSQGIIGEAAGESKVACPLHKKQFALETGEEIGADDGLNILTFPVKIENDKVLVELPAVAEVDAILGTHGLRVAQTDCIDLAADAIKVPTKKQDWNQALGSGSKSATSTTALSATRNNSTSTDL